ncbi:MmgE/PrpD family protein [Mesorhizobium sp. M4A.F.Ca.ET.050.02.1.1]|uniref:MmgE/PrpD family protein n=1 Tax=Mesorhizobium sp. M4A.F.Ca.ET.050.02.1.1 TaxID=2496754 RepID=UPI000FC9A2B4|nr:MmgE/PrpD family protein [Mesorhizobium sp. M4A.F.Ca.ET.050.02.1.1]RUX48991.1 MmgE/PrpD family protein [Mesorhizobium sp. M4A.F.Ca.ET.050.02.1.1]
MSGAPDLVHVLADHAARLRYEDLPLDARESAKKTLLDTIGVILAASGLEPAVRGVIDIIRESAGTPQSTVLGFSGKAPALSAALANGALAHCLDYDDQTPWGQHAGSSIVPAVFAVAERQGGVSGKELIAAVAAGQDIFARLRRNVGWKKDWNLSTVLGVFAATAAAARVMSLSPEQTADALGIATMQSSGIMEMVAGRGSDLRGLYAGFSAKGAVLAAMMAERGIAGIDRTFEGEYGFMRTYFDGRYDREAIVRNLGSEFLGSGTLYKRWPCVGTAHSHMKAAIDIVTENDLKPEEIAEIRLHVGDYHDLMCQPLEERRAPATLADAKFSLPFLVSVAIVRRGMSVKDFSTTGLSDPEVLDVGRKIRLLSDPALDWKLDLPLGRVEIVGQDERSWIREGTSVPGNSDNPLSWDDICAKFRECASVSIAPLAAANVLRSQSLARSLEDLPDATELIRAAA